MNRRNPLFTSRIFRRLQRHARLANLTREDRIGVGNIPENISSLGDIAQAAFFASEQDLPLGIVLEQESLAGTGMYFPKSSSHSSTVSPSRKFSPAISEIENPLPSKNSSTPDIASVSDPTWTLLQRIVQKHQKKNRGELFNTESSESKVPGVPRESVVKSEVERTIPEDVSKSFRVSSDEEFQPDFDLSTSTGDTLDDLKTSSDGTSNDEISNWQASSDGLTNSLLHLTASESLPVPKTSIPDKGISKNSKDRNEGQFVNSQFVEEHPPVLEDVKGTPSLDEVWPVQRRAQSNLILESNGNSLLPDSSDDVFRTHAIKKTQKLVKSVEPGRPTASSIEWLAPRTARPQFSPKTKIARVSKQPVFHKGEQNVPEIYEEMIPADLSQQEMAEISTDLVHKTSQKSQDVIRHPLQNEQVRQSAISSQQIPASLREVSSGWLNDASLEKETPLVVTDIGLLPADLWSLTGNTPPEQSAYSPPPENKKEIDEKLDVPHVNLTYPIMDELTQQISPNPTTASLEKDFLPPIQDATSGSIVSRQNHDVTDEKQGRSETPNKFLVHDAELLTETDDDLDELAQRVYQELRTRLMIERERSGGR